MIRVAIVTFVIVMVDIVTVAMAMVSIPPFLNTGAAANIDHYVQANP